MATLYVSDLDGTLLLPNGTLGERTVEVVNALVEAGGLFTYATARGYESSSRVTGALRLDLPVITYGGAVIVDPYTGQPRYGARVPVAAVAAMLAATDGASPVQPVVFANHGGRDRVCWLPARSTPSVESYLSRRAPDPRFLPLDDWREIDWAEVFFYAVLGELAPLRRLRDTLAGALDGCHVTLTEEIYAAGQYWLEVGSLAGTKAAALRTVAGAAGADRVVCFGDNLNDLPMFEVADESLAVANALDEVRGRASAVIGANAEEGVATWLSAHALA
ncbi:MAG TPA: HAD family hydrolase [Pseudonocardia sp.]|nr:HAD family hydrolase [Pseudonocardia sp.]